MIGSFNIKDEMVGKLSKNLDIYKFPTNNTKFPKLDGIIIDYSNKIDYKKWVYQAALIEKYAKNTKMIIFDRYLSIEKKEFDWLKKFNVIFFEPAINNRKEFEYLPCWVDDIKVNWFDDKERSMHIACDYKNISDMIKSFEKYYKQFSMLFPDKKICCSIDTLSEVKRKEYANGNIIFEKAIDFKDASFSIIIDSKRNYDIGYINENMFEMMKHGCVPLLAKEHKYFHALFGSLIVDSIEDIDYFTSSTFMSSALIDDILNNLKMYYPEFLIDSVSEVIINCFK